VFRFGISLAFLKIIFLQWRNFDVAFIPPLTLAPPLGGSFFMQASSSNLVFNQNWNFIAKR